MACSTPGVCVSLSLPPCHYCSGTSGGREEGGREGPGAQEEVDGAAIFSHQSSLEERGRRVWPCRSSHPLHLPPPLIPSPPLTLSRSPTPHNHSHPLTAEQLEATPTRSTPSPTFLPVASAPTNTFTLYSPASDRLVIFVEGFILINTILSLKKCAGQLSWSCSEFHTPSETCSTRQQ